MHRRSHSTLWERKPVISLKMLIEYEWRANDTTTHKNIVLFLQGHVRNLWASVPDAILVVMRKWWLPLNEIWILLKEVVWETLNLDNK